MNKQCLENIFDEMRNLFNVERELVNISYGLGIVGLNNLQEKISNLSDQINIIRANTKNAVSDHISADLKTAQEMSGTILKTALLKKNENTATTNDVSDDLKTSSNNSSYAIAEFLLNSRIPENKINVPQGLDKLFS